MEKKSSFEKQVFKSQLIVDPNGKVWNEHEYRATRKFRLLERFGIVLILFFLYFTGFIALKLICPSVYASAHRFFHPEVALVLESIIFLLFVHRLDTINSQTF